MTTMTSLAKGHDVNYFTEAEHGGKGACAGAMGYYTEAAGEPPGQWAGRAAAGLGLAGRVEADTIRKLYMEGIGPSGERLVRKKAERDAEKAAEAAVREYHRRHPYASADELDDKRTREKAKDGPKSVPYFDLTVSAVKSVSILHASYRIAAMHQRARGNDELASALDARAGAIEQALMDAALDAVRWLEKHAAYTRTGHHSEDTGEWRDGNGLAAARFLHHISRDGDPQLHVHVAIWNRVQRADGVDDKWRTLFGRMLYANRIGVAPVPDRFLEKRLRDLGFVMEHREDRNGCEVGGIPEAVMKRFSSRGVAVVGEMARLAEQWKAEHGGKEPSKRTLWLLHQQAGQNTRRKKADARRTAGGKVHDEDLDPLTRMSEWEKQTADDEMAELSLMWRYAEAYAREHAPQRARGGAPGDADDDAAAERALAAADADAVLPPLTPVADVVLTDEDKARVARVAVARVQERNSAWSMAQLRWEVHRALGPGVSADDITEIAELAVSGRAGAAVVQIGAAGDVADVTSLGVRASDGGSVYRPPGEELWCTIGHLDLEEHILAVSRRGMRQRVTEDEARIAIAMTDLTDEQAEAVIALLTATSMTVPVNAAAGSGKTHTMGAFAELWTRFTGGRVIGLTTSTNAARVLAGEGLDGQGLAEAYNIAQFLGKVKGSDRLRRPVALNEGDVLIVDEATQVSTADYALIQQAARAAGAFIHPVGDTEQLGAVDAGGIFQLIAEDIGGPQMTEILRFRHRWEKDASLRLRDGDVGAVAVYDRRGRIHGGDQEAALDKAAALHLANMLRGRDALLLAGSSAEAADLARRVQEKLRALGMAGDPETELSDGNMAGPGDLVRARLNAHIDAGGQRLTNRDTLRIVRFEGDGEDRVAWAQRRTGRDPATGEHTWSARFYVPARYLEESAELDYAGNAHVGQGRTVDASVGLVSQTLSRRGLYVEGTRGREENHLVVVTGGTAPPGKKPYEQATVESVLAGVMERTAPELSATAHMRAGQEWAAGAGHVLHLWSVAVREALYPAIDRLVAARLEPDQAARYRKDFARAALHARLREAQLAGHDIGELIDRITRDGVAGARSVASVLHSKLRGLGLEGSHDVSWEQRTPDGVPDLARELAEGLDSRQRELGARQAEKPEPWVARHLGVGSLAPDASPALRAEWERRAGTAAGYREAAGITDPEVAAAVYPHEGNPELETYRRAAMSALEIRDEAEVLAGMSRGELEAAVSEGDHAMGRAPANVGNDLRLTGRAKADAWAQSATARAAGDTAAAADAEELARQLDAEAERLEPDAARYEQWSASTAQTRDWASKARGELGRRGEPPLPGGGGGGSEPEPDPPSLVEFWRQVEAARPDAQPGVPGPGEPAQQPELADVTEPAADSLVAWWRGVEAARPAESARPAQPAPAPEPEPAAEAEPGSLVDFWQAIQEGRAPREPVVSGPEEAAESDTPAGQGPAPAGVDGPTVENQGDPRAAGTGEADSEPEPAARGAQPVPAASSSAPEDEAEAGAEDATEVGASAASSNETPDPVAPAAQTAAPARPDVEPAGSSGPAADDPQPEPTETETETEPAADHSREAQLSARLDDLAAKAEAAADRHAADTQARAERADYAARQARAEPGTEPEPGGWSAGIEHDEMEPEA
jgi:conjugative relaxase-like TrwC/TraI family protein